MYYRNDGTNNDHFFESLIEAGILPKQGTFFECGAYDGETSSSTFLLEKKYGWTGVLAEAIVGMAAHIARTRPKSVAVPLAVTSRDDDVVEFVEAARWGYSGVKRSLEESSEFACLHGYAMEQWKEPGGKVYSVRTISLNSLCQRYFGERGLTVCCLDMEGSELDVLRTFDFARFGPAVFTIESHRCNELLATSGYINVKNPFNTGALWEQCFVKAELVQAYPRSFQARHTYE